MVKAAVTIKGGALVLKKLAAINKLALQRVLVGIPSSTAPRAEDADITNAELGYIHEFGVPELNIPARPFLIPSIVQNRDEFVKMMKETGKRVLESNDPKEAVDKGLNKIGLKAQAMVRNKIRTGPFQPLAPATIAARQRRGVTRTKPLIDTGKLLQSITYVIRKK